MNVLVCRHIEYITRSSCYLSEINKLMSVVTIRRGHFMNSVFVNPGIYLCVVDAFLEISTFFYHMYQIYVLGMRLKTCFSIFAHIIKCGGSYSEHYF